MMSAAEVAAELGISMSEVYEAERRAISKLRRALDVELSTRQRTVRRGRHEPKASPKMIAARRAAAKAKHERNAPRDSAIVAASGAIARPGSG